MEGVEEAKGSPVMVMEREEAICIDSKLMVVRGGEWGVVGHSADVGEGGVHAGMVGVELGGVHAGMVGVELGDELCRRDVDEEALQFLLGLDVEEDGTVLVERDPVLHICYIKMKRIILPHFIIIPSHYTPSHIHYTYLTIITISPINKQTVFSSPYSLIKSSIIMTTIKPTQQQVSPLSFKKQSLKAEQEIFQYLPVYSQPSEGRLPEFDLQLRKFSQRSLHINNYNYSEARPRKLPSILRYQSQKYLKQLQDRRQQQQVLLQRKASMHAFSLKQLQAISQKSPSLPRLLKPTHPNIEWITPEEIMSVKMKLNPKSLPKIVRNHQDTSASSQAKKVKKGNAMDVITGWKTKEQGEGDLYQ